MSWAIGDFVPVSSLYLKFITKSILISKTQDVKSSKFEKEGSENS